MVGDILFFVYIIFQIILILFLSSLVLPTPISDTGGVRYRTIPWMTFLLILVNAIVFLAWQAPNLYRGIQAIEDGNRRGFMMVYQYVVQLWAYGYRTVFLRDGVGIGAFSAFTSMFMHGDVWHLLGNMIYLWTFGRRVEDACGSWRYLAFYLTAGMVASAGWSVLNPAQPDLPGVGASGAISGIMGAYLILFPGALVTCFWGIGMVLRLPAVLVLMAVRGSAMQGVPVWRWTVRLPAFTLLLFFLVVNALPTFDVIQRGQDYGGTNTVAHVTGFLAALVIFLYVRKDLLTRYFSGRSV